MISATIVGNLGRAAELKHMHDGTAVLSMSIASNGRKKVGGAWKDAPTWIAVSVFGRRAESLAKLELDKGTRVAVRGTLDLREYTSKDGRSGTVLEMRADDVELIGGGKRPQAAPSPALSDEDPFPL